MEKSNKLYMKALNEYENGYIHKAIDTCEKSVSINMKNKASLNLKGLLYYLKGDIKGAKGIWKLNSQINDDSVSKKYLKELINDEKKLSLYNKAVNKIRNLNIQEALDLLMECKKSDYNSINVNNQIANCYIYLAKYDKAVEYTNNVIKLDRKNENALKNKRQLISYGISKKNFIKIKSNVYVKVVISVLFISVLSTGVVVYRLKNKNNTNVKNQANIAQVNKNNKNTKNTKKATSVTKKNINHNISKKQNENNTKAKVKQPEFPYNELKGILAKKDYYKLYSFVSTWKNKNLRVNDKSLLAQGEQLLKNEGVVYFYQQGTGESLKNKQYKNVIDNLLKAYSIGSGNYLYPHIIYMLGFSYYNIGDIENTIKYFSQYDKNFPKGDYEEEVLYKLITINKNLDLNKAKQYAQKLVKNYPNSSYNNSVVKTLLGI